MDLVFSYVYTRLKKRIPSIKPLANILESIVFVEVAPSTASEIEGSRIFVNF